MNIDGIPESMQPAELLKAPGLGMFLDIPSEVYHHSEGVSNSFITDCYDWSLEHAHYWRRHPPEPTEALAFGEAAHCAILQPELFQKRYVLADQCEAINGKGERCKSPGKVLSGHHWYCGLHSKVRAPDETDLIRLPSDDHATILAMRAKIMDHPFARKLIATDEPAESSIWWNDQSGVLCRARRDKLARKYNCVLDYKTTTRANVREFEKSVWDYGYHRQAAFYLKGESEVNGPIGDFVFIAQEKQAPFSVMVYAMKREAIELGWIQIEPILARIKEAQESGEWPGYTTRIQELGIPSWSRAVIEKELKELKDPHI